MVIYNTTYNVHESVLDRWLNILRLNLIPSMTDDGCTVTSLLRVDYAVEEGYCNYALQLQFPDREALDLWVSETKPSYDADLRRLFGEKVLSFSTVMYPIAL